MSSISMIMRHKENLQRLEKTANLHYEAKLCIFGILKTDSATGKIRFVEEIAKTLCCSKSPEKQAILRNPQQNKWNPESVCGINEQIIIIHVLSKLRLSRNPQL